MTCSEQKEVWKDIPGYEGLYQISDQGRVRSLDRLNCIGRFCKGKVLRLYNNSVVLQANNTTKCMGVNQLLKLTFGDDIFENLDGEIWKPVIGYEELYEVSNKGRVRSLDRVFTNKNGAERFRKGKVLSQSVCKNQENKRKRIPYRLVVLSKDNKPAIKSVHRLVVESFIGPIPEGYDVRHGINGPEDNSIGNLSIGTREENHQDMFDHLKLNPNKKYQKLSVNDVKDIRKKYEEGLGLNELKEEYSVSKSTIQRIVSYQSWKDV